MTKPLVNDMADIRAKQKLLSGVRVPKPAKTVINSTMTHASTVTGLVCCAAVEAQMYVVHAGREEAKLARKESALQTAAMVVLRTTGERANATTVLDLASGTAVL